MQLNKLSLFGAALVAFLTFSMSACKVAEEDGYGRWDADSNAMIDRTEFGTAWNEAGYYGRWDANQDNFIDESEWNAGRNSYMRDFDDARMGGFNEWDLDGDGRLSDTEFRDRTFDTFDEDRDGNLAEAEYNSWWGGFNTGL